jgi:hypothetical protein
VDLESNPLNYSFSYENPSIGTILTYLPGQFLKISVVNFLRRIKAGADAVGKYSILISGTSSILNVQVNS